MHDRVVTSDGLARQSGMTPKMHIGLGIGATVILAVLDESLPDGGLSLLFVVGVLTVMSAIRGPRLPLFVRVLATGATFYLGYVVCLVGRTMEPGFTPYTFQTALMVFGLYATLPTLTLLRLWRGRLRAVVMASVLPVSLVAASAVAAFEEHQFIQQHPQGIGRTSRWTVSNHWLAYDAATGVLSGSD